MLLVAHCALLWRFVMRQQITFSMALSFVPLVPGELTRFSRASLNFNSCTLFTTSLPVIQFHDYLSVTLWFSLLNHLEIKVTSFILYLTSLCRIFYRLARVFTLWSPTDSVPSIRTHQEQPGVRIRLFARHRPTRSSYRPAGGIFT